MNHSNRVFLTDFLLRHIITHFFYLIFDKSEKNNLIFDDFFVVFLKIGKNPTVFTNSFLEHF